MSGSGTQISADLRYKKLVAGVLLMASIVLAALFAWNSVQALSAKGPFWFEGVVLGFINNMQLGRLYQLDALQSEPYSVLTHTPLSYLLGYGAYSLFPGYGSLRLVNIVLAAGCALLVANLSRLEYRQEGIGGWRSVHWFAAGIFLVSPAVFFWSQVARSTDTLACLFSLAALTALVGLPPSLRREVTIGVFWALAVLSKQSSAVVLAPVLLGYDVLFARERSRPIWRLLAWRLLFCGVVLLPVFGYLQWSTRGGFLHNVIGGNVVDASAEWWLVIVEKIKDWWVMCLIVVALGGLQRSATSLWFVSGLAFGLIGVAKRGADINYFFDASAALAILAAGVIVRAPQWRRLPLALAAILLAVLAMCWSDRGRMVSAAGDRGYASMIAWLSSYTGGKGQVLSDDAGIPVALGQNPVMDDPFVFAEWAKRGTWNDNAIVEALRRGKYAAVVVSSIEPLWSPAMRREIARSYALVRVFPSTAPLPRCVYVPLAALATSTGPRLEPYVPTAEDKRGLSCYPPEPPRSN